MVKGTARFLHLLFVLPLVAACGAESGIPAETGGGSGGASGSGAAAPRVVVRTATLNSAQEVPSPGAASVGTGKGAVVVDIDTREIRGGVTLTNLSGAATAVHVHRAVPGRSGSVTEVDLTLVGEGAVIPDGTILTQAQYDALLAGELYFHVNTTANTGGEIRGQIMGQGGNVAAVATLTGGQESPPVNTLGTGKAVLVVDSANKSIIIAAETIGNMTPTATHIHQAPVGVNAATPIVGLDLGPGAAAGQYVAAASHTSPLTDAQYSAFLAGELYFNVHSLAYANGEIRGQVSSYTQSPGGLVPTLASIQANVFTPNCAASGCHGSAGTKADLTLVSGSSYTNLVGRPSSQIPGFTRVIAGDPNNSLLIRKLEETSPPIGDRMPQGGPYLPQGTINVIRQWIQLGAPNS